MNRKGIGFDTALLQASQGARGEVPRAGRDDCGVPRHCRVLALRLRARPRRPRLGKHLPAAAHAREGGIQLNLGTENVYKIYSLSIFYKGQSGFQLV